MKYFLDTEFIEDGKTIDLVSIAVVTQHGDQFYAISSEFDESKANPWVQENVLPHLKGPRRTRKEIAEQLLYFVNKFIPTHHQDGSFPEFWGYFCDYDWVAVCQLFGTMMDLPREWPMFCMDLKQLHVELGRPILPAQQGQNHIAIDDALWHREMYYYLMRIKNGRLPNA